MDRLIRIVRGGFVHTLYLEQLRSCPEGFRYDLRAPDSDLPDLKADLRLGTRGRNELARASKSAIQRFRRWGGLPNIRVVGSRRHLIHSWQYPLLTTAPWVVDFEDAGAFVGYEPLSKRRYTSVILRALFSPPNCLALLPWTEKARESLLSELGIQLAPKIHVVYPAVTPKVDHSELRQPGSPRLLFVGSAFVTKGGVIAMRAFERVKRHVPDARLDMVTFMPASFRAEAERVPGLTVHTRVPPEHLDRLFRESYAMVAPYSLDTFGYSVLEAFAYGVPAIVSDNFALPELVGDSTRGNVVRMTHSMYDATGRRRYPAVLGPHDRVSGHPLVDAMADPPSADVDRLASAIVSALCDESWRPRRAIAALEATVAGPFSHGWRRNRLGEIYERASART